MHSTGGLHATTGLEKPTGRGAAGIFCGLTWRKRCSERHWAAAQTQSCRSCGQTGPVGVAEAWPGAGPALSTPSSQISLSSKAGETEGAPSSSLLWLKTAVQQKLASEHPRGQISAQHHCSPSREGGWLLGDPDPMLLTVRGAITLWSWVLVAKGTAPKPSCHREGLSPAAGLMPWLALVTGGLVSASLAARAAPKSG